MYEIVRQINNNIVSSVDEKGREVILRGKGIGFGKKPHDVIDDDQIEKIYRISGHSEMSKLETLMSELPKEYIELSTEIIDYAKGALKQKLSNTIYLSLTDHISFALQRNKQGQNYSNPLLMEIRQFYSQEYQIGKHALELIRQRTGVTLSSDEAGFIALHIVNAELNVDMGNTVAITELIQAVVEIIREYYHDQVDETTCDFGRLLSHLKYLGQRIYTNCYQSRAGEEELQAMVRRKYPREYRCTECIAEYIEKKCKIKLGDEEKMYLTLHMKRIIMNLSS